mgnify:CR=1 FL=1
MREHGKNEKYVLDLSGVVLDEKYKGMRIAQKYLEIEYKLSVKELSRHLPLSYPGL